MKAIALASLSLLAAAPALAHERDRDRDERHQILRINPEDFGNFGGAFELGAMRGGRLGVQISEMTEELRLAMGASKDTGILVNRVLDGSAAKKAGIQVGDVIVEVAGEPVGDVGDVFKALAGKTGDVKVEVIREKRHVNLTAKIEKPEALTAVGFPGDPAIRGEVEALRERIRDLEQRLEKLEKK